MEIVLQLPPAESQRRHTYEYEFDMLDQNRRFPAAPTARSRDRRT